MSNNFRHKTEWKMDWIGNNNIDKRGAQDYVLSQLTEETFPVLSHTKQFGRLWGAGTFEQILEVLRWKAGLYEILIPYRKRKIYFDIDKTDKPLSFYKDMIAKVFPGARMQVSGREGSWHIILSNYYADDLEGLRPVKKFAKIHEEVGFDPSVYERNKNMKCIGQAKIGQPVQSYIEGSETVSKHLIMHDFDEDAINIGTMHFDFMDVVESTNDEGGSTNDTTFDLLSIPQGTLRVPETYDHLTAEPIHQLAILPNRAKGVAGCLDHNTIWRVMIWCKKVGISFEDFWRWNSQKDATPRRYKKYLGSWNTSDKYHVSPKFVETLLLRFYPTIRESKVTERMRQHFHIDEEFIVEGENGGFYSFEDISPPKKTPLKKSEGGIHKFFKQALDGKAKQIRLKKFTGLSGPMGSGKTESLVKYIKKYAPPESKKRVVWMTPNITLSANTKDRLAQEGIYFANYKDIDKKAKDNGALDKEQYVICSIQSLHYLNDPFDIVIMDEIEIILATFGGNANTHKNISMNWTALHSVIDRAAKVVMMDALMTKTSVNFAKGFIRKTDTHISDHLEIFKTKRPPSPRTFLLYDGEGLPFDNWMTLIYQTLQRGEKIYIFTPFKNGKHGVDAVAKLIEKAFPLMSEGVSILTYYAEKEREKRELCDANEIWSRHQVRCVVTNSAISVGVNFDKKNIFDQIFCLYAPILPSRDFMQSMFRIRHPKSTDMIFCNNSYEGLGERIDPYKSRPKCPIYEQLMRDLEVERVAGFNNATLNTFKLFCEMANLQMGLTQPNIVIEANLKYIKQLQQNLDCVFDFHKIEDIDYHTYRENLNLIYGNRGTIDMRLQVEKYRFRQKFRDDAFIGEIAEVWNKQRKLIDRVQELCNPRLIDADLDEVAETKEHIVNQILLENGLDFCSEDDDFENLDFPDDPQMPLQVSLDTVKKEFQFDGRIKDYKSGLAAAILNAYFSVHLYKNKRYRIGKNRVYIYTPTDAVTLIGYCLRNRAVGKLYEIEPDCDSDGDLGADELSDCDSVDGMELD